MKLSDLHIELLDRARETLQDTFETAPLGYGFICDAIERASYSAVAGSRGIPDSVSAREIEGAREALLNGVAMALCGLPTLRAYMLSFVPGFTERESNEDFRDEWQRLANLARLAWLDRMIETRELV